MSHPYSDNLYSYPGLGNDEDVEDAAGSQHDRGQTQNAFMPINDFVNNTSEPSFNSPFSVPPLEEDPSLDPSGPSFNSPFSPPVLEEDPSIDPSMTGDSKAREAARLSGRDEDIYNADVGNTTHQSSRVDGGYPSLPVSSSTYATPSAHSQPHQAAYYPHFPSQAASSSSPYIAPTSGSPYAAYPRHHRLSTSGHSSSPFLFEAPPAYTPSPTSASPTSPLNTHAASSTTYQTFDQATTPSSSTSTDSMGRSDESTGLLGRGGPESMGGNHGDGPENVKPTRTQRVSNCLPSRETIRRLLLSLIVTVILWSIISPSSNSGNNNNPSSPSRPGNGGGNGRGGDSSPSRPPVMQYPDIDNEANWFSRYRCRGGRTTTRPTETFDVSFSSSKHLTINQERFEEDTHHYDTYVSIQGEVIVRRSSKDTPDPSITIDVTANDERILSKIETHWNPNDQSLTIKTPDGLNTGQRNLQLCATVKATVWVPEDAELNYLQIATIHLGVQLLDNLSLTVKTLARLDAIAGNIISASSGGKNKDVALVHNQREKTPSQPRDTSPDTYAFHPRRLEGCTTSGQIYGVWPLFDSLILKSTSGDIRIGIEPHDPWDSDSSSEKAELAIRSTSGAVDFRTHGVAGKSPSVPNRNYVLDVHTTSGNVHGLAPFSSSATCHLQNTSAPQHPQPTHFHLWPFYLYLPVSWEGEIVMNTLSGKLGVSGKDVKLIKSGEQWPGFNKEIVARKGDVGGVKGEGSRVKVALTSGSGEVRVG
ncbi:unnamed protein product [Sordaria macrospora k-hell]|uniref:WGS project CABT00000000 data, contig 2.3 n=1 Tax=Sordaria macrospora (strain ATCC MYA-333 / DSM 997 / K(L3346) / K-hell) TaxID=771870 RepID=F7VP84_SORMK|nr:uncharacterized protein SMAC_02321 [Sordaria macrospora k-hell]CCC07312.1 unnamed protein product [Sordaria macrospora k-hell]